RSGDLVQSSHGRRTRAPAVGPGSDLTPGPRRPARGHRRGGARAGGVRRACQPPLPTAPPHGLVLPRGPAAADGPRCQPSPGGSLAPPQRGLRGRHALFDPAVLEAPEPEPHDEAGEFPIKVVREGEVTTVTYPFHPFDVVGWKGDLAPLRLHVDDFRPVSSAR